MEIKERRKVASAGTNTLEYQFPNTRVQQYLYGIEIVNDTSASIGGFYLKSKGGDNVKDVCALAGRTSLSANDSLCWSGKLPVVFPWRLVAEFRSCTASDALHLKFIIGE